MFFLDLSLIPDISKSSEIQKNSEVPAPIPPQKDPPSSPWVDQDYPHPTPILERAPHLHNPARLIAFYLPQFHSIPENDEFWGKDFTEWTNVKKALPQFDGHYQPRVPIDPGYYDLRDTNVQKRQIELARLYGIWGFCFYFYWFDGKPLLETPTSNFLENADLNFPFCLCWANENWNRGWDGLDQEILIDQNHSPEDDLAFIEHVSRYMKDPRYIRVQDKPLLNVYRPALFPSPRETAERWRTWCRENGIGEIYLASTQSFDAVDPREWGFDGAIEFPPNNSPPPVMTDQVIDEKSDFEGIVYDWDYYVERSRDYPAPAYPLFRGVTPSWDNTARRDKKSTVFLNNTPQKYQEWLFNAVQDTVQRFESHNERLVFINAWNEWGEGAYLEPDQKYGYAYLEATRMALLRATHYSKIQDKPQKLAIIVHAFYPEVFNEILQYSASLNENIKLFITVPHDLESIAHSLMKSAGHPYFLMPVENKGRDILPFLKIINIVIEEGFSYFLKIHTKKSGHREDGAVWRRDIFDNLLKSECIEAVLRCFENNPHVGMVGPQNHIVSMSTYWGSNKENVNNLSLRMGIPLEKVMEQPFVAGSMFFARIQAILPLLNLAIPQNDFEEEAGQTDGTLAHAIERAFAVSLLSANMKLFSTSNVMSNFYDMDIIKDYQFTK